MLRKQRSLPSRQKPLNQCCFNVELLCGLAAKDVDRLQRLLNRAAMLVLRSKATIHLPSIRKDLHWLPIQERINSKIIMTVWIHRLAPNYLLYILTQHVTIDFVKNRCTMNLTLIPVPKVIGKEAFARRAPERWSKLLLLNIPSKQKTLN